MASIWPTVYVSLAPIFHDNRPVVIPRKEIEWAPMLVALGLRLFHVCLEIGGCIGLGRVVSGC